MLCAEFLETFSSSPMPVITTPNQTISTVSTTATIHHTSSVSSVKSTTTSATSVMQLRQGMLLDKLHQLMCIPKLSTRI